MRLTWKSTLIISGCAVLLGTACFPTQRVYSPIPSIRGANWDLLEILDNPAPLPGTHRISFAPDQGVDIILGCLKLHGRYSTGLADPQSIQGKITFEQLVPMPPGCTPTKEDADILQHLRADNQYALLARGEILELRVHTWRSRWKRE